MFDHVGFGVSDCAASKAFFRYYGAFAIGPDGHNVEAVCHQPEA